MDKIKKAFSEEIKIENQKLNGTSSNVLSTVNLLTCTKDEIKKLDPSICYDKDIVGGWKNINAIKALCQKMYGEEKKDECSNRTKFCSMCCENYLGKKFPDERAIKKKVLNYFKSQSQADAS